MGRTVWSSEHDFTVDGVSYRSQARPTSPDQIVILKPREDIEGYEALIEAEAPKAILELGIYGGGSSALLAQLARPDKLVAIDLRIWPCLPLERFIDAHDLRDVVVPCYGVDQSDVAKLDEIVAHHFTTPLDLVIDDASHLDAETRTSFNRLFPHLRPGGRYLIEDWSWAHNGIAHDDEHYHATTPLSVFICALVVAAACRPAVIAEVTVNRNWVVVRRGPRDLDASHFDVCADLDEVGQDMIGLLRSARTLT